MGLRHDHREQMRYALRRPLAVIEGTVSRQNNTLNVMVERAWPLPVLLMTDTAARTGSSVGGALGSGTGTPPGDNSVKFRTQRTNATRALWRE